jgi:hypothetical protein
VHEPTSPPGAEELQARQIASQVYLAASASFPGRRGHCRITSEVMCLLMNEQGLEEAQCVIGDYDHPDSLIPSEDDGHVWVEWRDLIFDARAEQFNPEAPLVTSSDDPRYDDGCQSEEEKALSRMRPTREGVAESFAGFVAWNDPRYAADLLRFAREVGVELGSIERYLSEELDLESEFDRERFRVLETAKAEAAAAGDAPAVSL